MTQEKRDFVILVDENDNETGRMEKLEAHQKALLHRAISVFIFNSKGEWLLQRRALDKYHSNGLWTNTTCSHPFPEETSSDAAKRRLNEEMGINAELLEIFWFLYKEPLNNGLTEHELDHVFVGFSNEIPKINKDEVVDWKYLSFESIKSEIQTNPEIYTVWFKLIFERVEKEFQSFQNM